MTCSIERSDQFKENLAKVFHALCFGHQMSRPLVKLHIAGIVVGESSKSFPFIASHTSRGDMLDAPGCLHSMGQYYYKTK